MALADGRHAVKARVLEPPEGGRANSALIKLLAKTWGLPKTRITLLSGHKERCKTVLLAGEASGLEADLRRWLAGEDQSPKS